MNRAPPPKINLILEDIVHEGVQVRVLTLKRTWESPLGSPLIKMTATSVSMDRKSASRFILN
jgi:hypothetical protein